MLVELDRYLDTPIWPGCLRAYHPRKGTGALRQAVRDELRNHPLVGGFVRAKPMKAARA